MKRIRWFYCLLVACATLRAEPSAFELQSGSTKKQLQSIQTTNKNLESLAIDYNARIQALEQSKDGVQSVLDGQSMRIKSILDTLGQQEMQMQTMQSSLQYQVDLSEQHTAIIDNMQKAIEQLGAKINDLATITTKLHQDILTEFGSSVGDLASGQSKTNAKQQSTATNNATKQNTQTNASADSSFTKLSNKEVLDEARKLFRDKKLIESKRRYEWLVRNGYRVPLSFYMLGEIEYQRGNFTEAINFYRKSASLDENASYMPILVWHTAWAFRYSKDMDNYNKFLDSLIRLYPESEQGKKALDLRKNKG